MTPETRRLLCRLADAFGVPGMEDEVRSLMAEALAPMAEISYDRFGCLIARHVGTSERPRVMLPAHMDEVGLIVRQITDDGFLRFVTTGGWWSQVLVSQRWTVRTKNGDLTAYSGVRGAAPAPGRGSQQADPDEGHVPGHRGAEQGTGDGDGGAAGRSGGAVEPGGRTGQRAVAGEGLG